MKSWGVRSNHRSEYLNFSGCPAIVIDLLCEACLALKDLEHLLYEACLILKARSYHYLNVSILQGNVSRRLAVRSLKGLVAYTHD